MKFRLSIQPKPKEFHSIVPSHLLSDPAFSADPRLNPYSVNNQQLAWDNPPQGHPVLKNKNRGPVLANFALNNGIVASADFDFQLIQPPNSPVSYIGGSGTQHQDPSFPFPTTLDSTSPLTGPSPSQVAPPTATAPSLNPRTTAPATSRVSIIHPQPPAVKEGKKKKRMPFILSRRKTLQATSSNPNSASLVSKAALLSLENDVPRAVAGRTVSESVLSAPRGRPVLPPRATTSGSATPRSMATSISTMSKRPTDSVRAKDLDRIDELDETNPLGLSLHHDGPYEAASQALKRGENTNPFGGRENGASDLIQGMQAYGRPYFPPQAPVGVSLNLSPGQILPRNFSEQRPNQPPPPPRMRDTSALPPRMQQTYPPVHPSLSRSQSQLVSSQTSLIPPRHLNRMDGRPDAQADPSRRRQSQPPPSPGFTSFPNPHPLPNPHPTMRTEPGMHPRDFTTSRSQMQIPADSYVPQASQFNSETNSLYQSSLDSRNDSSNSSISRRRSQNMPRPFIVSNPGPEPSYQTTSSAQFRDKAALNSNVTVAKESSADDNRFDIGMAMLEEPETPLIPTPRIFLPHGTPDPAEEFNPYDPIHLENEHSRTSSPSALTYDSSSHSSHGPGRASLRELSRPPSPVRPLEVPKIAPAMRSVERPSKQHENPPAERNSVDPPPYSIAVGGNVTVVSDDRKKRARQSTYFHMVSETRASSPSTSPERVSLRPSIRSGPSDDSHYSHHSHRSNSERPALPPMQPVVSQGVYPTIRTQDIPPGPQQHWRDPDVRAMQSPSVQNGPPAVNQEQRSAPPDPPKVMPMLPARRSRERLVPSNMSIPSRDPERDGKSTHQTISTTSSGQHRSGPPPRRHVPKHLVMPTPLNNANSVNANPSSFATPHRVQPSSPPAHISSRQVPPRRAQVAFQPQAHVYYPPPSRSPLASNVYISPTTKELQDIQITASRKLKKRASVVAPPSAVQIPSPPVITTVSFAPPVIGYGYPAPAPVSKTVSRLKNEKIPKRVLSKRRTDL